MNRKMGDRTRRADMVVSVHPLTQDIPLKILNDLDTNGKSRNSGRTTPFVTVVTDLGGAHPTWFNPGYVYLSLLVYRHMMSTKKELRLLVSTTIILFLCVNNQC